MQRLREIEDQKRIEEFQLARLDAAAQQALEGQSQINRFCGHLGGFRRPPLRNDLFRVKMRLRQKRDVDVADNGDFTSEERRGGLLDVQSVGFPVHKSRRDESRAKQKNQQRCKCNQQAAQIDPSWLLTSSAWPDATLLILLQAVKPLLWRPTRKAGLFELAQSQM